MSHKTILTRNSLNTECFFGQNGKLRRKIEHYGGKSTQCDYRFDSKGRLMGVEQNGELVEGYVYDMAGRREWQYQCYGGLTGSSLDRITYDSIGRNVKVGATGFSYNWNGALFMRSTPLGVTVFNYGADTLLDEVTLLHGGKIRYEYDPVLRVVPARRFKGDCLAAGYGWHDALHLAEYLDYEHCLNYVFLYDVAGALDMVRITRMSRFEQSYGSVDTAWLRLYGCSNFSLLLEKRERLHALVDGNGGALELYCGTDQVGTLKYLTDMRGRLIKAVLRDSFGVRLYDSLPELFMPVGFAGGLEDPDTGLVHFGYRDYDPTTGRFTAPDPLGDTGGDHDLYEYCVDDPVTMNDPTGLHPAAGAVAKYLLGKGLALGIAAGGAYGTATVTDAIKASRDGQESTVARDGVTKILPPLAEISLTGTTMGPAPAAVAAGITAIPHMTAVGARAFTNVGQRLGAAIQSSPYGDKVMKFGEFLEGALNPNPAVAPPFAGAMGTVSKWASEELQRLKNEK